MQQPYERRRSGGRERAGAPSSPAQQSRRPQANPRPPSRQQHIESPRRAPRHFGVDPEFRSGQEIKLLTNAYNINTANRTYKIHEYDLLVEPSVGCKDLPPKVLSRTYVSRSIRQLIMDDLIPSLLDVVTPRGAIIIGQNLEAIYSLLPFKSLMTSPSTSRLSSSPAQQEFKFVNIVVATDLISHLRVDITIKFNRLLSLIPANYSGSLLSSIIHHQLMIRMLRYGSVYYSLTDIARRSPERLDLISKHLMGIAISGARRSNENQTLVVINSSHSYITHTYRLIDLLASYLAERPVERVELRHEPGLSYHDLRRCQLPPLAAIIGNEEWFATFCTILNGFKCKSMEFNGAEVNLRFNLTSEPASALLMDGVTSVLDYYMSMGILINYPNLPCLKSRNPDHPFHPFEMCSLLPGQKVPIFRLSTAARNHLILMNKPHPNVSRTTSIKARDEVSFINKGQFSAFGVSLSQEPVEASGCTLNRPMLQYKNQTVDPHKHFWESTAFYQPKDLVNNWSVIDTAGVDGSSLMSFLKNFSDYSARLGMEIGQPLWYSKPKQEILAEENSIETIIAKCSQMSKKNLRFILFVIDSTSTQLNRMIHVACDDHPTVTALCLRTESVLNERQQRSIFRTLVHKLNTRLGGTNFIYHNETLNRLSLDPSELMIVGLDVTHPDNELSGVSIVGCAYTYSKDLFRHKSLVWPQAARKEIITRMDKLVERLLNEYKNENKGHLPKQIIVYRDGVSNEEFERVRVHEITKAKRVIEDASKGTKQSKPNLSYIIAQKRHTMRFYQKTNGGVQNPPGGTLINQGIVSHDDREFYLFSNMSPQATARPLHYHVLLNGLGLDNLQKLTYYLCFNFGKCSSSLSMPSSLRYAHNAAYDARNRVIASKEFSENKFYTTKFFC